MVSGEDKNPAQWAIDLLEGKNYFYKQQFYNKYFGEIMCGLVGTIIPVMRNYFMQRHIFSAIWQHVLSGVAGVGAGRVLTTTTDAIYAKRDAILLDYVKRHPERFPEPPNRKYSEILNPWYPMR